MKDWTRNLEHPDITHTLATGYPIGKVPPASIYCEECGKCLDEETIYEDTRYNYLCKDCLLTLHERW